MFFHCECALQTKEDGLNLASNFDYKIFSFNVQQQQQQQHHRWFGKWFLIPFLKSFSCGGFPFLPFRLIMCVENRNWHIFSRNVDTWCHIFSTLCTLLNMNVCHRTKAATANNQVRASVSSTFSIRNATFFQCHHSHTECVISSVFCFGFVSHLLVFQFDLPTIHINTVCAFAFIPHLLCSILCAVPCCDVTFPLTKNKKWKIGVTQNAANKTKKNFTERTNPSRMCVVKWLWICACVRCVIRVFI